MHDLSLGFTRSTFSFDHARETHGHGHDARRSISTAVAPAGTDTAAADTGTVSSTDALSSTLAGLNAAVVNLRARLDALSANVDIANLPTAADAAGTTGFSAHLISKQRGELQIHTQEGDVITLRFSNKVSVDYASQQVGNGDASASSESLDVRSRTRVTVSVQGNLNDQELQAVNDLVGKVGSLTNEFYNGNIDDALSAATSLSYDSSQLADFSLHLSLKQRVVAQGYASVATVPLPSIAPAGVSAENAVTPSTPEPVTVPSDIASSVASTSATATEPAPLVDPTSTTDAVPDTTGGNVSGTPAAVDTAPGAADSSVSVPAADAPVAIPAASATQLLAGFVAKVRQSLQVSSTDASLGFSYEFKVRLLIASISASAPAQSPPNDQSLNILTQQVSAPPAAA